MKKVSNSIAVLLLVSALLLTATSCTQLPFNTSGLPESSINNTERLDTDYETLSDKIDKLEKRVYHLEQILDVAEEPTDKPTDSPDAYEKELHNIQTATMALMADSDAGVLDAVGCGVATNDMDTITADATTKVLSSYTTGLNADGTIKTIGVTYTFTTDGTVTQTTP